MMRKKARQKWLGAASLLEEQSHLPWERTLIILVIVITFGFIEWASRTPVDELVSATGELVPESHIVTVQAGIPGIVQDILVGEGSVVKKDQVLVKLQIDDNLEDIRRYNIQRKGLKSELYFIEKELKARKELADEGLFPSLSLLQLQAKKYEIRNKIEELNETSKYRFGSAQRSIIVAPVSGQIQEFRIPHKLASVHAGEALMEIVPQAVDQIVSLKVKPSDIGHIHVGQDVILRVTTFDPSRYGVVEGKLTYISPATIVGRDGLPYFQCKVHLGRQFVTSLVTRKQHILKTGMMVDAEIKIGSKTVLQYLLKPVLAITAGALHER